MGVERAVVELGVLIYPGAQMAAVHGLTDLFGVANRIAAEHQTAQLPLLRISHWRVEGDQAPERVYDSQPGPDGALVAVLIPPSIGGFSKGQAPQGLIPWTVGYQDPSAFRATFKKITGLAPSDYRTRFGVTPPAVVAR
jgi:transcriptional regulator GlxA family with amidase domain